METVETTQNPIENPESQPSPKVVSNTPSKKMIPKWVFALLVLLVVLSVGYSSYLLMNKTTTSPNSTTQKTAMTAPTSATATATPNLLKIYQNKEYGFELSYPARGKDANGVATSCGTAIKELKTEDPPQIVMDSFFAIYIVPYTSSLDTYIQDADTRLQEYVKEEQHPPITLKELFTFTPIVNTGADEAMKITIAPGGKEKGAGADNLPFSSDGFLYKKGNIVFVLSGLQDYASPSGCIPPGGSPSWRPSEFVGWDVSNSMKFTN